jgi:hypothetical protein
VKLGRRVLFALLLYVTLDLSLPAMPGAFVFEPTDSVESAQMNRGRVAGEVDPAHLVHQAVVVPAPPRADVGDGPRPARNAGLAELCVVNRLPRATLASAPPSEDPL